MPNWFYLTIHLSGKDKDVEQFVENVKGSEKYGTTGAQFDFNHFIPQPDNIYRESISSDTRKELDAKGIPNWYDWNVKNWGTKWNANVDCAFCLSSVEGFPTEYEYQMATAWADPRPVLHKMFEMYPDIDFTISGSEEADEYGIYISTSEDIYLEEEPIYVNPNDGREVHWDGSLSTWLYNDDGTKISEQRDFYPIPEYSWDN